jgi:O-antigen/teichoic acid export membrane protein
MAAASSQGVSSCIRRTSCHADRRCQARRDDVACITIDDRTESATWAAPAGGEIAGYKEVRRIGRGALVGLVGGIVSFVLTTAYQFVVARRIGAAGFGVLALALAIASFLAEGSDLGLDYGVLRFGAIARSSGEPGRFRAILRPSLIGSMVIGGLAGVGLAAASNVVADLFHRPDLAPALVPLALSVPFTATTEIIRAAQRALGNAVRPVASSSLIGPGLRVLTAAIVLSVVPSATAAAWAYFTTEAATLVVTWLMLWRLLPPADGSRFSLRTLFRFSMPMSLNRVLLYSNNQTEVVFLGFLASASAIGIFSLARRFSVLVGSALMTSITILFNPLVADLHHFDRTRELDTVFKTATRWMVTLAMPISLVFMLFPGSTMRAVGPDFSAGATALVILAFGQLVNVGTGTTSNLQAMAGYAKLTLLNSLLFLSLSIVFDLMLIPPFGLVGAAVANSSSLIVVNLVRLWQIHRNLGLFPYDRSIWRPLAAAIPASIVAKVVVPHAIHVDGAAGLLISALVLGVIYLIALVALGIEPIDRQLAHAALRRLRSRRTEPVPVGPDPTPDRAA